MRRKNEKGQVALILVLAVTVAGALVISLADRSTRDLRSQSLDTERVKALKGAESGVEDALLNESSVTNLSLGDGVNYVADYSSEGRNGMVSDIVQPGDVIDVLVEGSDVTLSSVRIYFSSEAGPAALKVSEYRVNGAQYLLNSQAFDSDATRALVNQFSDPVTAGPFSYKDVNFESRSEVAVSTALPTTRLIRIMVLYSASKIGIEPVGGNLPDQQVVISSTGEYSETGANINVRKRLELRKEMEKVPSVFDRVLYSNSKLEQ